MKIQISFFFFLIEKNSDLHLMKMQISFFHLKKFRSASNEYANQFFDLKRYDNKQIFEIKK